MKNSGIILEDILERYKFREPVPENIQANLAEYKRISIQLTLKHFGDYSLFYGIVIRAYNFSKRLGVELSIAKIKLILIILSLIITATFATAAYFTFQYCISCISKQENISLEKIIPEPPNKHLATQRPYLGIHFFKSNIFKNDILKNTTEQVAKELSQIKGSNRIIKLNQRQSNANVDLLLFGSLEKLGKSYIISIKIINVETSEVLFQENEVIDSLNSLDQACSRLVKTLAKEVL